MKELKFIHITKCAGTTIEELGKNNNIFWGQYHKEYGWWHQIFSTKPKYLKDKYNWFMVVRNPYDRIISEYYCKWGGQGRIKNDTVEDFNKFLLYKIKHRDMIGHHYTEQYKYLDENYDIKILKFENLKNEFNQLMNEYNLDIKFDKHYNKSQNKKFTLSDLSKELIELINQVYKKDFEEFNYKMIIS